MGPLIDRYEYTKMSIDVLPYIVDQYAIIKKAHEEKLYLKTCKITHVLPQVRTQAKKQLRENTSA